MRAETELPAEIVDLILDKLVDKADATASIISIRSCASVSRVFRVCANRHLFSEFKLSISLPHERYIKPRKFLNLLQTSRDFFSLGMIYHLRSVSLILEFEDLQLSRGPLDAVFAKILDLLHGPHHGISAFSLDLQAKDYTGPRSGDWSRIGADFVRAFHDLCCSPNLETLRLKHFLNVPRSILQGFHIKHLELQVIHFLDSDASIEVDPTRRCDVMQIESLVLPTYWLLPTVVAVLEGNVKPVLEFHDRFQLAFAYLNDLTITVVNHNRPTYLHLMPQLRSLRLLHLFTYPSHPKLIVHPMTDFFSYPDNTVPSSLRHLTMEMKATYYSLTSGDGKPELREEASGWPAFDMTLSGNRFKHVQDMHLILRFPPERDAQGLENLLSEAFSVDECRELILRHLPCTVGIRQTTFFLAIEIGS